MLVERLVQHGLADRREDPRDRRRALVALTADGESRLARLREGSQGHVRAWIGSLEDGDLAALARGLGALASYVPDADRCGRLRDRVPEQSPVASG